MSPYLIGVLAWFYAMFTYFGWAATLGLNVPLRSKIFFAFVTAPVIGFLAPIATLAISRAIIERLAGTCVGASRQAR